MWRWRPEGRAVRARSGVATSAAAQPLVDDGRGWVDVEVVGVQIDAGRNDVVDLVEEVIAEFHVYASEEIGEVLRAARANQHRTDRGVRADEGDGQMCERQPDFGG